jgi:hypothetical protein
MSLKASLIQEAWFPTLKAGPDFIEDEVVSLFPNRPGRNDEDFHEKIVGELTFGLIHHSIEISCKVPMDVEEAPAGLTEWTGEEEVKSDFFPVIEA